MYQCKEAFRLMQYQEENNPNSPIEWLWNSRDGVTPFTVCARDGDALMDHINRQDDIFAIQYVPNIGQRVFIDLTEEVAYSYLRKCIDRWWTSTAKTGMEFRLRYTTREGAFAALLSSALGDVERRQPDVVVVDAPMQRRFVEQREARRRELCA